MTDSVTATDDGLGYWVQVGSRRSFISSYHLAEAKVKQLNRLNRKKDQE